MNRLLNMGFINVGHWTLTNDNLKYNLISNQTTKNILYSFVSNGEIKYVGKTTTELNRRMYGYQNPSPSQSTNLRVNERIKELLKKDKPVDIFIHVDNGLLRYGDLKINLAAGLEDSLIYDLNPKWNFSGKNRLEEDIESNNEDSIIINNNRDMESQTIKTFEIILGKTYYRQGFFNVSQKFSDSFGADKAIIEILLGNDNKDSIQGNINRTANPNGTPRIMGRKGLTDWIQNNFKENDLLKVDILTNVSIKLNKK